MKAAYQKFKAQQEEEQAQQDVLWVREELERNQQMIASLKQATQQAQAQFKAQGPSMGDGHAPTLTP